MSPQAVQRHVPNINSSILEKWNCDKVMPPAPAKRFTTYPSFAGTCLLFDRAVENPKTNTFTPITRSYVCSAINQIFKKGCLK